jgi:hypothetical protein
VPHRSPDRTVPGTFAALPGLIAQGLRAALLRQPSAIAAPLAPGLLFAVIALHLAAGLGIDWLAVEPPRLFDRWALAERCLPVLLALFGAAVAARVIGRPAIWLRLAAIALIAALPAQAVWVAFDLSLDPGYRPTWPAWLLLGYAALAALRLLRWAAVQAPAWRPLAGTLLALLLLVPLGWLMPGSSWWWTEEAEFVAGWMPTPRDYSAEALLYAQPAMLQAALDRLAPQRPGEVDLFAIGFAADGGEGVFRNEVEHLERLMATRFAAPQRTLSLINHPGTLVDTPLATLTNLRQALAGIASRIDVEQDILLLFLTSHGSAEHELHVALHDLPLDLVTPQALRDALDEAGIGWRLIVVSACYSGGFIDALRDPRSLIVTAARSDRTSFGCGVSSELTWFGQSFLVDGLNHTVDFVEAFEAAREAIRQREREQDEKPSHPQIEVGERISAQLQRWRDRLQPGPPVEFVPAVRGWRPESDPEAAQDSADP